MQSALRIDQVAEPYIRGKALRLSRGRKVVIFAAGTGKPVLHHRHRRGTARARNGRGHRAEGDQGRRRLHGRSAEGLHCHAATAPLTFDEAIVKNLKVMDATALALCRDQNMLLKVFSIFVPGALKRVVMGEDEGTLVHC